MSKQGIKIKAFTENSMRELRFIAIPKNATITVRRICENSQLVSTDEHHVGTDSDECKGQKTICIVREPSRRFASAVRFALSRFSHTPIIAELIDRGLKTPSAWIDAMRNPAHPSHELVWKEIRNHDNPLQQVSGRATKNSYVYEEQLSWMRKDPDYLLKFEELDEGWSLLREIYPGLPALDKQLNATSGKDSERLSNEDMRYINALYIKDYWLWSQTKALEVSPKIDRA